MEYIEQICIYKYAPIDISKLEAVEKLRLLHFTPRPCQSRDDRRVQRYRLPPVAEVAVVY